MVNVPSVPEIITVNSEALQEQIRDLLPSQNGFGSELQASNVITPIIDLTAAAEGSGLPAYLQQALSFGSQTAFDNENGSTVVANIPGFYRIVGAATINAAGGASREAHISMTDGSTTKIVWMLKTVAIATSQAWSENIDLTFFLSAGDSISVVSDSQCTISGSVRQIATGDGTLVQPNGFPL